MKTHVLKGSKQEIAEGLARIIGEVREAIIFEEEPLSLAATSHQSADIFAEMELFMVDSQQVDDSRESVYMRMDCE